MRYFSVEYEWHTRPWYKKGRIKTVKKAFAAGNLNDALKLAQEEGTKMFPRHKWKIIRWEELTPV